MKVIIPLAIAFTVLALGEGFLPPPTKKAYAQYVNPCAFTICPRPTICIPVSKRKAKCVRIKKAKRVTRCTSNSDCNQQGSICNIATGICECAALCLAIFDPICDRDGNQYGNRCELNRAACLKKITIIPVPCK